MKFTLEIEMGNDDPVSYKQLLGYIRSVQEEIKRNAILAGSVRGPVLAGDGGFNAIGKWEVTA